MLIVSIAVNLNTIHTVSAINTTKTKGSEHEYDCFEGLSRGTAKKIKKLYHNRDDGASILAIKMLEAFPK